MSMAIPLPIFTGMDIVLITRPAAISDYPQSSGGKHITSQSPAINLFAWEHCMESSKDVAEHQEIHLERLIVELIG